MHTCDFNEEIYVGEPKKVVKNLIEEVGICNPNFLTDKSELEVRPF